MLLALVLVAALVTALLCVPITADISIRRERRLETSVSVRWGQLRAPSSPVRSPPRSQAAKVESARSPRAKGDRVRARQVRALLFSRDFLPSLGRLLRRLLAHVETRDLHVRVEAGLGDPAATGRICGLLAPVLALLCAANASSIVAFEPDFLRRRLKLDCRATVRVVPGALLAVVLRYCFTPAPWRALSAYARAG